MTDDDANNEAASLANRRNSKRPTEFKLGEDFRFVFYLFFSVLGIGFLLTGLTGLQVSVTASLISMTWGAAATVVGAIIGFLFGIPKVVQSQEGGVTPGQGNYQQVVNTNLTEISDWLTKIIVGLGLIELNTLPDRVIAVASILAKSLNEQGDGTDFLPFAIAVLVGLLGFGFFFSYLSTRLYLASAFSRADKNATMLSKDDASTMKRIMTDVDAAVKEADSRPPSELAGQGMDEAVDAGLERLVASYRDTEDINDARARNDARRKISSSIDKMIVRRPPDKTTLSQRAKEESNEGYLIALAECVEKRPAAGDMKLLFDAVSEANSEFARCRVVYAIHSIFKRLGATAGDKKTADKILGLFETYEVSERLSKLILRAKKLREF